MRRRLVLVFLAVSTLVAVAFVIPLGFLVSRTAEDRAIDAARADAAAVVPAIVSGGTLSQIESAVGATASGSDGRMSVTTATGLVIGEAAVVSPLVDAALSSGDSNIARINGGVEVVAAVATGPDELSAIRVYVADEALQRGKWRAWGVLAAVGVSLVAISVFVADRLARSVVEPTRQLAQAARRLGGGDLAASVEPEGPEELLDLAGAFNDLGLRVSTMLDRERELVADLSHRLRTPLTKLRLRLDQVEDQGLALALQGDVDDLTQALNGLILEARGAIAAEPTGDLRQTAIERAEFWKTLADDQSRPWIFTASDDHLPVAAPEPQLAAAMDVLIENVFAHTPERTALSIACHPIGDQANFVVADAGPGMDDARSSRGSSGSGSTGLGLDIARKLAADFGGSLHIGQSDFGGVEVVLALPIVREI